MADAKSEPLVAAMRRATRRHHHVANALILAKLAVALTDRQLYAKALGQFLPVYTELEASLKRHRGDPALAGVAELALALPSRADAMRRDLEFWLGPSWQDALPPSASAAAYADHLRALGARDPALLLPYAWSLHVPILLGFMGRRIGGGLGIEGPKGLEFFEVPDKAARLEELRAAINAAGARLPPAARAACVDEAAEQFRRNNSVVREFRLPAARAAAAAARAIWAARGLLLALLAAALAAWAALRARRAA